MNISDSYVKSHIQRGAYIEGSDANSSCFENKLGWTDARIGDSMIFSHRDTYYTKESFTEGLHTHEFYELLIYVDGEIEYIKDNTLIRPDPFCAIWFTPGQMHTARLISHSRYERYVLYFSEAFFECNGVFTPIIDFMNDKSAIRLSASAQNELFGLLKKAEKTLASGAAYAALLAKSYLVEIFAILNGSKAKKTEGDEFKDEMAKVKLYIDNEYATISSTSEIAEYFYYSREHLSRRFRAKFNISLYDYLVKRRVMESLTILKEKSVAEASYAVGFKSQSSYISAFVKNMGCLPSEYKKLHFKQENDKRS